LCSGKSRWKANKHKASNRSLEDLDEYYRGNPALIVTKDKDAISSARPAKFIERETEMVQRQRKVGGSDKEKDGAIVVARYEDVSP